MTTEPEILTQLEKINHRLDQLTSTKRLAAREFLSGLLRSLGYTLGTALVILISVYFLSKMNFSQKINNYIQNLIPKTQINVPFSQLLPDQL
ncbi:hypothetical protein KBB48_00815 [Candidatus Shapirobacteria bacterium]|nr:hypothetical protein [Candidatus Shapirobacteria bacterium]